MNTRNHTLVVAYLIGALFGAGLLVSGMVMPARIVGFLDPVAGWDPTLAFVMVGALAVTTPAFRYVLKRERPWFADAFSMPTRKDLDARLMIGAVLFGIGWGLAALCPGPALTDLVTGRIEIVGFVAAMLTGMLIFDWIDAAVTPRRSAAADASAR